MLQWGTGVGRESGRGGPHAMQAIALGSILLPGSAVKVRLQGRQMWPHPTGVSIVGKPPWAYQGDGSGQFPCAPASALRPSAVTCFPHSPSRSQPAAQRVGEQHRGPSDDTHPLLPGTESQCCHTAPQWPGPG